MEVNNGLGLNYKPRLNGSTSSSKQVLLCWQGRGRRGMHRRLTRVPSFSRKRPAAPARANSHLGGSLGAGRRGGKGHELRGGGLMSGECWSIESETDPSSTSQSRKYHSAHLSEGGYLFKHLFSPLITVSHPCGGKINTADITVGYVTPDIDCLHYC